MLSDTQSSQEVNFNLSEDNDVTLLLKYLEEKKNTQKTKYKYIDDKIEEEKGRRFTISTINVIEGHPFNLGVIADRAIKKGKIIGYYKSEEVSHNNDYQNNTRYLMRTISGRATDASYKFNWTRFLNHSCYSYNCKFEQNNGEKDIAIRALKDINLGEQLLIHYGDNYIYNSNHIYLYPTDNNVKPETSGLKKHSSLPKGFDHSMLKDFDLANVDQCYLTTLFEKIIMDEKDSLINVKDANYRKEVNLPCYFLAKGEFTKPQNVTPLMFACYKGYKQIVRSLLLEAGVDPLRATLYGGRNSMVFTILGKAEKSDKAYILDKLLNNLPQDQDELCSFVFHRKDSQGKTLADYIIEQGLSYEVYDCINKVVLKDGKFSDSYSHLGCFVDFIDQSKKKLNCDLEVVKFHSSAFSNQERSTKDLSQYNKKEIQANNYIVVKNVVSTIVDSDDKKNKKTIEEKTVKVIEKVCTMLSSKKKVDMYKEVFTHCVCYIENDQAFYKAQADKLLDLLKEEDISWHDKMRMFNHAFHNVVHWNNEDLRDKPWNCLPAFIYLMNKISANELGLIYSMMEANFDKTKLVKLTDHIKNDYYYCIKMLISEIITSNNIKKKEEEIEIIKKETSTVMKKFCTILSSKEKVDMYKEVFTHCVCYIESDQDSYNKARADKLLDLLKEEDISPEDKMIIFKFAFQEVVRWHKEVYDKYDKKYCGCENKLSWDSLPGFSYLRENTTDPDFETICSSIEDKEKLTELKNNSSVGEKTNSSLLAVGESTDQRPITRLNSCSVKRTRSGLLHSREDCKYYKRKEL